MLRLSIRPRTSLLRAVCAALVGVVAAHSPALAQASWPFAGADIFNSHAELSPQANINSPTQINPKTASSLRLKWSFVTSGDISATPTVEPGGLYVPDWGGTLYKINPTTGAQIWSHNVCDYTSTCFTAGQSISRTSPAISTNVIVIGDAIAHPTLPNFGAVVIGVSKATGAKVWSTVVNNSSRWASVLGSPVIYNNIVYVGTASWEEGVAGSNPGYKPIFRGNVSALNVNTGAIIWQFTTVPANPAGYSGGAIPGSSMSIWPQRNALLFSTGNNYSVPQSVSNCVATAGSNIAAQTACLDPTNYVDAMMSVDLTTGKLNWGRRMSGADSYTEACDIGLSTCPTPTGTDSDFAQAPILTWLPNFNGVVDDRGGTSQSYMVGAGQKNSIFYAMNPINGGLFWSKFIGIGGMEWGSTLNTDDYNAIYVALHNPQRVSQQIVGQSGVNPQTWNAGAWGSLNVKTGATQWMVPTIGSDLVSPGQGGAAPGCMTFTNRVVFAGSSSGIMVAMDGNTGRPYWTFSTGGTVVSCPSIWNETVYWGTGYARHGVAKHMLYAFAVPG